MSRKKERIDTSGGEGLSGENPFGSLSLGNLPEAPKAPAPAATTRAERRAKGPAPRLDVRRLTGGKGGKTVTEISGFIGVNDRQLADLAKELKAACGVGGTVKGRVIEIQGDQRDQIAALLTQRGYRVVLAGG